MACNQKIENKLVEQISKTSNDESDPKPSSTSTNRCDQELMKYVLEVIQEIKSAKQQCHVNSINDRLKRQYGHIYARIPKLTDKELMLELEMAVNDGQLSKTFRKNASSSTSETITQSGATNLQSSEQQVVKKEVVTPPEATNQTITSNSIGQKSNDSKSVSNDNNNPRPLLKLVIKSMAAINKQNFSSNDREPKLEQDQNTCTLDDLVKHMCKKTK